MASRIPSLNVLTVFEAAARHLSFKNAAEELCISSPAVSHQIKVLEKQLGVSLFKRLNRALALTPIGQAYYDDIHGAIKQLSLATSKVLDKGEKVPFRVDSVPFITNIMLVPHIQSFQNNNPDLSIQIKSQTKRAGFFFDDTDVAIRHTNGGEPNLHYELLTPIQITPVCSPSYLQKQQALGLTKLEDFHLIQLTSDSHSWPYWLSTWNQRSTSESDLCLDNYQAVLEAVKQGQGVAMGYLPLLTPLIEEGELAVLFPNQICEFNQLYLVYLKTEKSNTNIASFQSWLISLIKTHFR